MRLLVQHEVEQAASIARSFCYSWADCFFIQTWCPSCHLTNSQSTETPFTRYNRLSNAWTTGLTTGCIVYTNIQPVVQRVVWIQLFDSCNPISSLLFNNRLNNRLHRANVVWRKHETMPQTSRLTSFFHPLPDSLRDGASVPYAGSRLPVPTFAQSYNFTKSIHIFVSDPADRQK